MSRRQRASATSLTFADVEELALGLPRVERGTAYGAPAVKIDGKLLACVPTHRSAEPESLAVRIDFADRDELIASDPDTFYIKDHYVDYACVLVRLRRIHRDALRDLLQMAHRFMSAKRPRVQRRKRSGSNL